MAGKLEGQTALVTGGSRGIGRACALALAENGANVVLTYRGDGRGAEETAEKCRGYGVQALAVRSDVSDSAAWKELAGKALSLTGTLEILVNNAGITRDGLLLRMEDEDIESVIKTNLFGAFYGMRAVCRAMMKQRYGRIISISSAVGLHGNAGQTNYAASKAGIIGLTKSLAKELVGRHITVNAVAPGFIETDMTKTLSAEARERALSKIPLKEMGSPEDIANAVVFLALRESRYITGQVISVDGGMGI